MIRDGHDNDTNFFIGTEVEHTPAYGQRTLFVVGIQSVEEILTRALNNKCPHIYLGANQSFDPENNFEEWEQLAISLLSEGIWVTLDIDIQHVQWLNDSVIVSYETFIPMISAKIPHISNLNYNATLKIDDVDFKATNPGVWCHSVHSLMDRAKFTDWTKYTSDQVID